MTSSRSRQLILLLAAFAMGAGSLLVAGSALADQALFRVQQAWHSIANPGATVPGGAGEYQAYVIPYLTKSISMGNEVYIYTPGVATVTPNNQVGAKFTLPTKQFLDLQGTYDITAKTGWPGYTTYSYLSYYNGPVRMRAQNTHMNQDPVRVYFPTTNGNPVGSNLGIGNPNLPTTGNGSCADGNPPPAGAPEGGGCGTTTFNGLYDFQRGGEINVTPGPRQFGGTYRYFHGPNNSTFYQFISKFTPLLYWAYGQYTCLDDGVFGCTKDTFHSDVGDTTAIYTFTRFLLNGKGTGTGDRLQSDTAKATTPTPIGAYPTDRGTQYGVPTTTMGACAPPCDPASYITAKARYLQLIHPWTTGFGSVSNPADIGTAGGHITPQYEGYDIDLQGEPKVTVYRINKAEVWNKVAETLTTTTMTAKSYIYNVGRVVSLVRPKLIHTYTTPTDKTEPIWFSWGPARMWRLKVWFLPEPTGMLLLGTGIAALLGLARIRRR